MDAIIIADSGPDTCSVTSSTKLTLNGQVMDIQSIQNIVNNSGDPPSPVTIGKDFSWASTLKLNGVYLYSYLTGEGFNVELIDSYFEDRNRFIELLGKSPKVIIVSTTFIYNKKILQKVIADIRSLAPDIFIIAGGPFVHLSSRLRDKLQSHNVVDMFSNDYIFLGGKDEPPIDLYIISLTGEQMLSSALRQYLDTHKIAPMPNTALFHNGDYEFSEKIEDIAQTSAVAIDWQRLPDVFFKKGVVAMQASYGCPFHCVFCNFVKDGRRMGIKPLDMLLNELLTVQSRGAKYVWFMDDNFRLGRNDLDEVCRVLINNGVTVKWKAFLRADTMIKVDMDLLKSAGCIEILIGLESADAQILKNMDKRANSGIYAEAIEKALRAGINCTASFLFGFPGETDQTALKTRQFMKSIEHPELTGNMYFTTFPFIVAPLSPISEPENAQKYGLTGYMFNWKHDTMDSKKAAEHAIQAFADLETSGTIYPTDNLDMLLALSDMSRKQFITSRNRLAKKATSGQMITEGVLVETFADILKSVSDNLTVYSKSV